MALKRPSFLRFFLLSSAFYPWLEYGTSQAIDLIDKERHDLFQEGQSPSYISSSNLFIHGTPKLRYTLPYNLIHEKDCDFYPEESILSKNDPVRRKKQKKHEMASTTIADTRYEVPNPASWPYCVHGHLSLYFGDEKKTGSGILVGPHHVLTAAHNLYQNKQWVTKIIFSAGRKGKKYPFGQVEALTLLCPLEWIQGKPGKDKYDFGMVILKEEVGVKTGWAGLLCAPDIYFEKWEVSVTGYPGEKRGNDYYKVQMWEQREYLEEKNLSPDMINYSITTSPGQSGGAIWRLWPYPCATGLGIFTIGVHTDGSPGGRNHGVRLKKDNFDQIVRWISQYSLPPSSLSSLRELKEQGIEDLAHENKNDERDHYIEALNRFKSVLEDNEKGNIPDEFLCSLADCYWEGKGTKQDYLEAFNLYVQTSNPQNQSTILARIGKCYLEGLGIPKDIITGLHFLNKAEKQNDVESLLYLYHFYNQKEYNLEKARLYKGRAKILGIPLSVYSSEEYTLNVRQWKKVTDNVPFNHLPDRSKNFQESRQEGEDKSYLTKLWDLFHENIQTTIMMTSLGGMGGIGKSTLALQYAYEALDKKAYNHIYWILSETNQTFIQSYKSICLKLSIFPKENDTNDQIIDYIKISLSQKGNYLLIYDNVPRIDFLDNKCPQSNGHILITSRIQKGWDHPTLLLEVFSPRDSIEYLFKAINISSQYANEQTLDSEKKALEVAEKLGHLPLALSHAASYINYKRRSNQEYGFNTYVTDFKKKSLALFKSNVRYSGKSKTINYDYFIGTTIEMARALISSLAQNLLTYCSYLDPDTIVKEMFFTLTSTSEDIEDAFSDLITFSLLKNNDSSFSIHRLMQLVIRNNLSAKNREKTVVEIIEHIMSKIDRNNLLPNMHLVINSETIFKHVLDLKLEDNIEVAKFILSLADCYRDLGKFKESCEVLERYKSKLLTADPNISYHYNNSLGISYTNLGNIKKAIKLLLKAQEFILNSGNQSNKLEKALVFGHLGMTHIDIGNYKEAEKFFTESINIYIPIYSGGKEGDDRYVWVLAYAGDNYGYLGKYEEAKKLLKEGGDVCKKSRNHLQKTAGYSLMLENLGKIYIYNKKYEKAKEVLEESIKQLIASNSYGEKHIGMAYKNMYLGKIYHLTKNLENAKKFMNAALDIFKLNHQHPKRYMALEKLGDIYSDEKLIEDSKKKSIYYFEESLKVLEIYFPKDCIHIQRIKDKLNRE